jgi:hypothetical protein
MTNKRYYTQKNQRSLQNILTESTVKNNFSNLWLK